MPADDPPPATRAFPRRMRRAPTVNEATLWRLLRDRRLEGLKFRRQVPIGPYIADFICFEQRLIVEADGPLHDPKRDATRDAWFAGEGFRVLRFPNQQVFGGDVVEHILRAAGRDSATRARALFPPAG